MVLYEEGEGLMALDALIVTQGFRDILIMGRESRYDIYDIEIDDAEVKATISLTSPGCPVAGQIVEDVRTAIEGVDGVDDVEVELTFEPPWTPDRIAPLIRASLGL